MLLTFTLLSLAILAVWVPPIRISDRLGLPVWMPLFLASLVAAWSAGLLRPLGLLALLVFGACVFAVSVVERAWLRRALSVLCAAIALALSMHLVPGFANPLVFNGTVGEASIAHRLFFNYDKGVVGLMLLAWLCQPITSLAALRQSLIRGLSLGVVCGFALMGLAWGLGYVKWDPKWSDTALSFLWANLFLTCLAEEAFFRGWLQARWAGFFEGRWAWVPVALSAVLFGLVHLPGGLMLAILASVAGLIYAGAFARYRQIEVSILIHFLVNAVHFVGFTYPRLS